MLLQQTGEAYLNFTGSISTEATLKSYLYYIQRYAAFRKTLDLDKIVADDSQNLRMATAHIKEFLSSLQVKHLAPG